MPDDRNLDVQLDHLLSELRVTLPGVQVLFAFLLILPFSQGFGRIDGVQRAAYFIALTSTALSSILLIAPTPFHRLRWRARDKDVVLRLGSRLTIAGTAFLAIGMTASIFVIADVVYNRAVAVITSAAAAIAFTAFWYGLALVRKVRQG